KEKSPVVIYQHCVFDNKLQEKIGNPIGINQKFTTDEYVTVSTADITDTLLTICSPVPWNKLILRDFIIQKNIHFQALPVSNDVFFHLCTLSQANKISLYYKSLVNYRYNRKESLSNIRDKHPLAFYEVYSSFYKFLKKHKLYDVYKKSFLKSLISSSLWTLHNTNTAHEKVKKFIKNKIMPKYIKPNLSFIDQTSIDKLNRVYSPDIIVSLTSYPARIDKVHSVIESLFNQTFKADKVVLWLAPEQFPNREADLPQQLLDLTDKGLTIDWYHDIKSYKKLIPALKKYPDALIVTADDDIIYPSSWLLKLHRSYMQEKDIIWAHRAHRITYENTTQLKPYKEWNFNVYDTLPEYRNFCTTGGGVLYPPKCFYKDVLNENLFMKLCPTADDIWFWAMCVLNHKKIGIVKNNMLRLSFTQGSQDDALWKINVLQNNNDKQLNSMLIKYPQILNILQHKITWKDYVFFPYTLLKQYSEHKRFFRYVTNNMCKNLLSYRIDFKNIGIKGNNVIVSSKNAQITKLHQFNNQQGSGKIIEAYISTDLIKFKIKVVKNGTLQLKFRGIDRRYQENHIPLWVKYVSIKIDSEEILKEPICLWHNKHLKFETSVCDNQEIVLELRTQPYNYSEENLKDTMYKLGLLDKDNINSRLVDYIIYLFKKQTSSPRL
ncbi:MAG: hypothetical protein IJF12_04775, partial [Alphaproteobacteria bacterium]|nr:hypothetical protein [Alphaproteobacteria bacterium]